MGGEGRGERDEKEKKNVCFVRKKGGGRGRSLSLSSFKKNGTFLK